MASSLIHAVILGPEASHRAEVKNGLSAHPIFRIVHEGARWEDARERILKYAPDVIFGDPEIGRKLDLEWIDEVPGSIAVVLAGADASMAVQAFEKRVLDYLLKPISSLQLKLTIARLIAWKAQSPKRTRKSRTGKKLVIHRRRETSLVSPHSIVCVKAEGNYTEATLRDGSRKLVHRPLRRWKELLPVDHFLQIHRSTLINLEFVKQIESCREGKRLLHLASHDEPVLVSRRMASELKRRLRHFRC